MSEFIKVQTADGVMRVVLDRLQKKNALTVEMYAALSAALQSADSDPAVRVVLIHGTEDCFTSGNDLKDFMNARPTNESNPVSQFLFVLARTKTPIVAAVAGPAIGIGTTLLLHCDLIYAGENTRFQLPFVNLGLCPEAASSYLLPQIVGYRRAAELLLLGEPFTAPQALAMGLINGVVPDRDVIEMALAQANKLAALPPGAVTTTKALLKRRHDTPVTEVLSDELREFTARLASPESQEAFAAFFERRKPDFSKFR